MKSHQPIDSQPASPTGKKNLSEALACKAMKSYKFTRGNMLPPSQTGLVCHEPAKLANTTYFEQLYDDGPRGNLGIYVKHDRSHLLAGNGKLYISSPARFL
ncbi:hypothetical protein PG996_008966 [Apiospora saccharicola]|uniref:Uncharacterized protein n=1 Tax=Apiospora saccharicola TaxID=335842 RepID=A0ABR1UZF5_9PEZI